MERGTLIAGWDKKKHPSFIPIKYSKYHTFLLSNGIERYFYQKYSNGRHQQSPILVGEERMDLYCKIKQWGLRIHYTATIFHLAEFSLNTHLHFNAWIAQHSSPPPPLLNLFGDSFAYDCINLAVTANYLGRGRGRENSFKLM